MSRSSDLGALGENFASRALGLTLSENAYDQSKDGTKNGETYEIKTQNRYPLRQVFSIAAPVDDKGLNNILKCFTVDHLIFVEYDHSDIIRAWECVDRSTYEIYRTRPFREFVNGKTMIGFPICRMVLRYKESNPKLAQDMRGLSSSAIIKGY